MNKKMQTENWNRLTPEFRKKIRECYDNSKIASNSIDSDFNQWGHVIIDLLIGLLGKENIESDIEPEELWGGKKAFQEGHETEEFLAGRMRMVCDLFGSRGFADTTSEINIVDMMQHIADECSNPMTAHVTIPEHSELTIKKGDKVKILGGNPAYIGEIVDVVHAGANQITVKLPNGTISTYVYKNVEPYTAPTDKAEEKKLDLTKVLRGHENLGFFSPYHGDIKLVRINDGELIFSDATANKTFSVTNKGTWGSCFCTIFPSKELYEQYPLDPVTAWKIWADEQKPKFTLVCSVMIGEKAGENSLYEDYGEYRFRTKEDAEYVASEIHKTLLRVQEEISGKEVIND